MYRSNGLPTTQIWLVASAFIFLGTLNSVAAESEHIATYDVGRPATQAEIQKWDIDIAPNGDGLPPGRGTVTEGAMVYANTCASCHGMTGIEGPMPNLVGGQDTLETDHPLKTVGSYWPFATTLFDYIYRTMPLTAPQSLSPHEVYAVVAWILFRNGIVEKSSTLDAQTLPTIAMPNRNGFVRDARPDASKKNP